MGFDLSNYEQVQDRLPRFFKRHEDGRVVTRLHSWVETGIVFEARLYKNGDELEKGVVLSTGWAHEIPGRGHVNRTSPLENCETSAIGRALANIGLHGDRRASREEMEKVQRGAQPSPAQPSPNETLAAEKQKKRLCVELCENLGATPDQAKMYCKQQASYQSLDSLYSHLVEFRDAGYKWDDQKNKPKQGG